MDDWAPQSSYLNSSAQAPMPPWPLLRCYLHWPCFDISKLSRATEASHPTAGTADLERVRASPDERQRSTDATFQRRLASCLTLIFPPDPVVDLRSGIVCS